MRARFYLSRRGYAYVCVDFTSVGVTLFLLAWFLHCGHGYTFVNVVLLCRRGLPMYAWFNLCMRSITFVGVVALVWAWI